MKPFINNSIHIVVLILLCNTSFGQDTTSFIHLKPIEILKLDYRTQLEKDRDDYRAKLDSLNNSDLCLKERQELNKRSKDIINTIDEYAEEVKQLNEENMHSLYYYYIKYKCVKKFEFKHCGTYEETSSRLSNCIEIEIWIDKTDKSRIIWDGPTGDVFYYEDIRRLP